MKISGKIVVLFFILLLPILFDLLFKMALHSIDKKASLSGIFVGGYLKALPFYFIYLSVATLIMKLIENSKK